MRQVAKTSRNFFGETFAVLGAALSVSAAVRAHRKPARADLEALGIDGKAFDKVSSKLVIVCSEATSPRLRLAPESTSVFRRRLG